MKASNFMLDQLNLKSSDRLNLGMSFTRLELNWRPFGSNLRASRSLGSLPGQRVQQKASRKMDQNKLSHFLPAGSSGSRSVEKLSRRPRRRPSRSVVYFSTKQERKKKKKKFP